jgi:hypothetical protein
MPIFGTGITFTGGITFTQPAVANLPNPYTANYQFTAGQIYTQQGPVTINPDVVLTLDPTVTWTVTPD